MESSTGLLLYSKSTASIESPEHMHESGDFVRNTQICLEANTQIDAPDYSLSWVIEQKIIRIRQIECEIGNAVHSCYLLLICRFVDGVNGDLAQEHGPTEIPRNTHRQANKQTSLEYTSQLKFSKYP